MERIIKTVTGKFTQETLDFVEKVFTEYSDEEEGKLVRELVAELSCKRISNFIRLRNCFG